MSEYRHATDRKRTIVYAGCPDGCQEFELETEGKDGSVDELVAEIKQGFGECAKCGEPMGFLRQDEPSEVLE